MADISDTEFEVLDALWQGYPAPAQEIVSRLNQVKPWHEKTVKTLLSRLVKKEAISFEKEDRRYIYTPLISRESYVQHQSQNLIEKLFSGRISPLIAGFARNKNLDKDDIDQLKNIIADWEAEQQLTNDNINKKTGRK